MVLSRTYAGYSRDDYSQLEKTSVPIKTTRANQQTRTTETTNITKVDITCAVHYPECQGAAK